MNRGQIFYWINAAVSHSLFPTKIEKLLTLQTSLCKSTNTLIIHFNVFFNETQTFNWVLVIFDVNSKTLRLSLSHRDWHNPGGWISKLEKPWESTDLHPAALFPTYCDLHPKGSSRTSPKCNHHLTFAITKSLFSSLLCLPTQANQRPAQPRQQDWRLLHNQPIPLQACLSEQTAVKIMTQYFCC